MTTTVKERPVLFSSDMVRAILDGRKTQTRRVVKPQPPVGTELCAVGVGEFREWRCEPSSKDDFRYGWRKCPYGLPGDKLWCREAFCQVDCKSSDVRDSLIYRADEKIDGAQWVRDDVGWSPSIHMPRWASRITLEVTNVRVERVQEISEADAKAEGINPVYAPGGEQPLYIYEPGGFHWLWDSINAKRGHSWESNPWVWCVEFKRVDS